MHLVDIVCFVCTVHVDTAVNVCVCVCVYMCKGEFGTVFRGMWKEQPKKQVAVAVKTLKVCHIKHFQFDHSV